ncbi:MAG: hypothetical protein DCC67_14580 [Planctomycetota bacterium]|nr:MAG: hypothetical protein DCC67_14580 [Planctomycetota bacterium]
MASAVAVACLLSPSAARAALAFFDDFEGGTIGAGPTSPVIGNPWALVGNANTNLVHANPLVNADNGSAQVLRDERSAGSAGRVFIDLSPAQSAQIASGELLTIRFQHYQPDPSRDALALLVYPTTNHDFLNPAIDLEFHKNRAVKHYNNAPNNFVDTGLVGTDGWDDVEVVLNYATDTWSVSLNGGVAAANLPFVNNDDQTTGASILLGPSQQNVTAFVDNVRVYVGAIPEPASLASFSAAAAALPLVRRRRRAH